jgi:hypothetical protein
MQKKSQSPSPKGHVEAFLACPVHDL